MYLNIIYCDLNYQGVPTPLCRFGQFTSCGGVPLTKTPAIFFLHNLQTGNTTMADDKSMVEGVEHNNQPAAHGRLTMVSRMSLVKFALVLWSQRSDCFSVSCHCGDLVVVAPWSVSKTGDSSWVLGRSLWFLWRFQVSCLCMRCRDTCQCSSLDHSFRFVVFG